MAKKSKNKTELKEAQLDTDAKEVELEVPAELETGDSVLEAVTETEDGEEVTAVEEVEVVEPQKPIIHLDRTNLGEVTEGDAIHLTVTGVPEESDITWMALDEGSEVVLEKPATKEFEMDMIATVGVKYFQARIVDPTNPDEFIYSEKAEIAEMVTLPLEVVTESKETEALIGETFTYTIGSITPEDDAVIISWMYQAREGQVAIELLAERGHKSITISKLTEENSGIYYPVVTRHDRTVTGERHVLTVRKEDPIEFRIQLDKEGTVQAPTGGTFTIKATVENATPLTTYTWYHTTGQVSVPLEDQSGNMLTLTNLTEENEGSYYLEVSQGESHAESSAVTLRVISEPDQPDVIDPEKPLEPGDLTEEEILAARKYPAEIQLFAASIARYCKAMHVSNEMTPAVAVSNHISLNSDLLRILRLKDIKTYMAAMDMVVDYFWVYRTTVFAPRLATRYIDRVTPDLLSSSDIRCYQILLAIFSDMATPADREERPLTALQSLLVDPVVMARLSSYYSRKMRSHLNATLLTDEEYLEQTGK